MFNTPVLLIIFNRPDTTAKVFASIREVRPKYLYVAADGPRANHADDQINCEAARKVVTNNVDWDCEVKYLFRDQNLGCGEGVFQSITWFFEHVEQGIILEDDCLPDLSFYNYCEELLNYYKDEQGVMHISGDNFQYGKKRGQASYYFTKFTHNWGWATWRRAWAKMDFDMISYPEFLGDIKQYTYLFNSTKEKEFWLEQLSRYNRHEIDNWDLQWLYSVWKNKGIGICPNVNLVSNIGFNVSATHTRNATNNAANLPTGSIGKIIHPAKISIDKKADSYTFANHFDPDQTLVNKVRSVLLEILSQRLYDQLKKVKNIFVKN